MKLREKIFNTLIKDYIKHGQPVGSKYLKKIYFNNLASSTIRWHLRKLTKDNLLINANKYLGRIPTDKGWRIYLENNKKLKFKSSNHLSNHLLKKTEKERIDWLLKRFCLYLIMCYNNYYIETGLDYVVQNIEFNNKEFLLKLAYLIKEIKNNKIKINFEPNQLNIFIGREVNISNIDDFSIFCWQKEKNKFFLISPKRINYPLIYSVLIKNFI